MRPGAGRHSRCSRGGERPARTSALPWLLLAALLAAACTTPLEAGERYYREGDRLAALESWRKVRDNSPYYEAVEKRITEVEQEFDQLVVRYKKRAEYYEEKGRLAESVLNYRLALKLQPDDRETLDHVQSLIRVLAERREELRAAYREQFEAGDLPAAREALTALRTLDPLSPEVTTDQRQLNERVRHEVEERLARGRAGYHLQDYDSAEQAFQEVLVLDPENDLAHGFLSRVTDARAEQAGSSGTAGVRDARGVNPNQVRADGAYQKALAAEREGKPFVAIRNDLAALHADRNHARARIHLRALRDRMAPEVDDLVASGREHYQQEELEEALDQWRRALLIDPANAQAKEYVARAESLLENLDRLRGDADGAS